MGRFVRYYPVTVTSKGTILVSFLLVFGRTGTVQVIHCQGFGTLKMITFFHYKKLSRLFSSVLITKLLLADGFWVSGSVLILGSKPSSQELTVPRKYL
jgi:hypothetical protein